MGLKEQLPSEQVLDEPHEKSELAILSPHCPGWGVKEDESLQSSGECTTNRQEDGIDTTGNNDWTVSLGSLLGMRGQK